MRLKALELQGFKTFPDKTTLTFEDGISAVVGPNGSGKSNISDAMRWVLGEQSAKSLRCVKMEDVIFSGTPSRKAQNVAEVTLTIDNSSRYLPFDGDTVAITRRYYRSGDSEYLINKATVRLRDIHELFMDTGLGRDGYSMIGQGKIDSIISAKSEERREIFEEAAGISRYRYRKEESERKLQKAEENLLRLQDILNELEGRVGPLREQSEKASQYIALYDEKRKLEIGLWLHTLEQSGHVLQEHEKTIASVRTRHDAAEAEAQKLDAAIEALFFQTNECLAKAEQCRNEGAKALGEGAAKESEISVLQNDIHHNEETIARLISEQSRFTNDSRQYEQDLQEKQREIAEQEAQQAKTQQQLTALEQELSQVQEKLEEKEQTVTLHSQQLQQLSEEGNRLRLEATQSSSTAEEIQLRLTAIDGLLAQRSEEEAATREALSQQSQQVAASQEEERATGEEVAQKEGQLAQGRQRLDGAKQERDHRYLDLQETTRRIKILEDLERNLEGFGNSVKTVMRLSEKGELTGVHGPVSKLLTVPKIYSVAMETALGGAAQNIVVSTEADAKAAIALLKKRDGGRATFLPITTINGKTLTEPSLRECPGFIGIAGALCQCEEQYRGIMQSLLGRIVVAETLDHAVAIAKRFRYQFRVVTLDGQQVNAGGSMTGGSQLRKNGLLSRGPEIAALKKKAEELERIYQSKNEDAVQLEGTLQKLEDSLRNLRQTLAEKTNAKMEQTAAESRLSSALEGVRKQKRELEQEREIMMQRYGELSSVETVSKEKLSILAEQMMESQQGLDRLEQEMAGLQEEKASRLEQMQSLRMVLLTMEKDLQSLQRMSSDLSAQLEQGSVQSSQIDQEMERICQKNQDLQAEITRLQNDAQSLRQRGEELQKEAERLQGERMTLEQRSMELRTEEKERSGEKETLGRELSRLEEQKRSLQRRYDEIIEQLWTEYELTRREAEQETSPVENAEEGAIKLKDLKSRIKKLGNVNLSAIEEYAEVSERYEFLTTQVADVEKSRTELRRLIRELTGQMTEIFKERFAEINGYFQTTFTELFGGGKARLELSDPENVLESGIVILAQPPGKIVKNLELLSGGEKALVAVSLYFSIMKCSPPPFCMLDEIEAALDDVNVVRFAEYLRRMNENTQFIVITHRRGTMEEADILYGVTMQEEGISKLLRLNPSEVGSQMGLK